MSTKTPIVQIWDIFQLWQHYIICWDSTKEETYKQLLEGKKADVIITDPPYNVNYKWQWKNTKQGIKNDNMSSSEFYNFLNNAFHSISSYSKQHTPMYIFHSHKTQMIFEMTMNQNNINIISQLIRNKPSINHVWGDYKQKHEPFFYASNWDPKRYWDVYQETVLDARRNLSDQKLLQLFKSFLQAEQEGRTTIFSVQRHNVQDYVHPTQKPVRLIEIMMHNSSHIQDVVLDPFLWSWTTLITAEKTQRICYWIELDRKYIEVIIARYRKFTKNNWHIKCLNRQIDINKIIDNV
jgi:DNA modification methylase